MVWLERIKLIWPECPAESSLAQPFSDAVSGVEKTKGGYVALLA
jgi:hypothetical protein